MDKIDWDDFKPGFQSDGSIRFDANYGRMGLICVTDTVCQGCGKAAMCLYVDPSENEYTPGTVCRACIDKLFAQPVEGKP